MKTKVKKLEFNYKCLFCREHKPERKFYATMCGMGWCSDCKNEGKYDLYDLTVKRAKESSLKKKVVTR